MKPRFLLDASIGQRKLYLLWPLQQAIASALGTLCFAAIQRMLKPCAVRIAKMAGVSRQCNYDGGLV